MKRKILIGVVLASTTVSALGVPHPAIAITGGSVVSPPGWLASFGALQKEGSVGACGGVLIAPDLVATAAHCVVYTAPDGTERPVNPAAVLVPELTALYLGSAAPPPHSGDLSHACAAGDSTCFDVIGVDVPGLMQPAFEGYVYNSGVSPSHLDIAVLRLDRSASAKPLRLAGPTATAELTAGTDVQVWGYSGPNSGQPKRATLQVQTASTGYPDFDEDLHLPADLYRRCPDEGDSGGPLTRTSGGVRQLVGIVSFGPPCRPDVTSSPDIFTRVSFDSRPRAYLDGFISPGKVFDGSFELPDTPDGLGYVTIDAAGYFSRKRWYVGQGTVDVIDSRWQPFSGSQSIDLNGCDPGSISQIIRVPPSKAGVYRLQFKYAGNPDGGVPLKEFRVEIFQKGSVLSRSFSSNTSGTSRIAMGWKTGYVDVHVHSDAVIAFTSQVVEGCYGSTLDSVNLRFMGVPS